LSILKKKKNYPLKIFHLHSLLAKSLIKSSSSGFKAGFNRIDVMVSVLVSSAVDRELESPSDQTKDYKIGICCFSSKHAASRRKDKDWLARNQNNVSEWSDMSTRGLLFQ